MSPRCVLAAMALAAVACITPTAALDNGLALTPQMGWNSWNKFGCNVSDSLIRATAKAMVSTGLAAVGYNYVNIDDCWQTNRDASGRIIADPDRFPDGVASLVQYVESLGLHLGLYSDAGLFTCQHRPGGLGYETIDAQTYAEWGVKYLKYDNCFNYNIEVQSRYTPMRDALNATGVEIFFSMCEWGQDKPYEWAPDVGNSWRTTGDINDSWASMLKNIDENDIGALAAGPGGWNDPDMLEVGNGGMTLSEYVVHFSLWALAKAPLIIGCDVTNIDPDILHLLTNQEVIAVNQDALGVQGRKIFSDPTTQAEIWAGPLVDGWTVVLFNRNDTQTVDLGFTAAQIRAPLSGTYDVRDLWSATDLGTFQNAFPPVTLEPHTVRMFKVTAVGSAKKDQQRQPKKILLAEL